MTTAAACRAAGISERQAQWWDEKDIVRPHAMVGHRRVYTGEDVTILRVVAELRRMGLSLLRLRKVTRALRATKSAGKLREYAYVMVPVTRTTGRCLFTSARDERLVCDLLRLQRESGGPVVVAKVFDEAQ